MNVNKSSRERRLLFIDEILPRRLARTIGILPRRTITEVKNEAILEVNFRMHIPTTRQKRILIFLQFFLSFISLLGINNLINHSITANLLFLDIVEILVASVVIFTLLRLVAELFTLIPRYSLSIHSRFFTLRIPYIKGVAKLNEVLK